MNIIICGTAKLAFNKQTTFSSRSFRDSYRSILRRYKKINDTQDVEDSRKSYFAYSPENAGAEKADMVIAVTKMTKLI